MNAVSPIIETRTLQEDVTSLQAMVKTQNLFIEKLMIQLAPLYRHRFGARSEGLDQLGLTFEECEDELAARNAVPPEPGKADDATKKKPKCKALPTDLQRARQSFVPASTDYPCCGSPMRKFAEDMREILDYLPASCIVRQQIIEKFSCCDCGKIVEGEPLENPIANGTAGPGLLAHILVSKYVCRRSPDLSSISDLRPAGYRPFPLDHDGIGFENGTPADTIGRTH